MLQVARFDPDNLVPYRAYDGHYNTWEDVKFDTPHLMAAFVEKRPGDDLSAPWLFWNDEVWYVVQGALELEWTYPPYFNDHEKTVVRPGDVISVPQGARVKSTVLSQEPVRMLWVTMPRPRHFGGDQWQTEAERNTRQKRKTAKARAKVSRRK